MPDPLSDLPDPAPESSSQKAILVGGIAFLVLGAVVVGGFVTGIPLPVRLFIVGCDLLAAAALWLVLRQKSDRE